MRNFPSLPTINKTFLSKKILRIYPEIRFITVQYPLTVTGIFASFWNIHRWRARFR